MFGRITSTSLRSFEKEEKGETQRSSATFNLIKRKFGRERSPTASKVCSRQLLRHGATFEAGADAQHSGLPRPVHELQEIPKHRQRHREQGHQRQDEGRPKAIRFDEGRAGETGAGQLSPSAPVSEVIRVPAEDCSVWDRRGPASWGGPDEVCVCSPSVFRPSSSFLDFLVPHTGAITWRGQYRMSSRRAQGSPRRSPSSRPTLPPTWCPSMQSGSAGTSLSPLAKVPSSKTPSGTRGAGSSLSPTRNPRTRYVI